MENGQHLEIELFYMRMATSCKYIVKTCKKWILFAIIFVAIYLSLLCMRRPYHEHYIQNPVDTLKENGDDNTYRIMNIMPKWTHFKHIIADGSFVRDLNNKTAGTKTRKVPKLYEEYRPDSNLTAFSEENVMLQIVDDIIKKYDRLESNSSKIPLDPEVGNLTCVPGLPEDMLCMKTPQFLPTLKSPCWYKGSTLKCLPYFHLIGVNKCATTDLYWRLQLHPQVVWRERKELMWWSRERYGIYRFNVQNDSDIKTFADYLDFFDPAAQKISSNMSAKHDIIAGDATAFTFWDFIGWPKIPQNKGFHEPKYVTPHLIRHMNPNVKLIVIFRDPLERLYSHYYHRGRNILTPEGFHNAVVEDLINLHTCIQKASLRHCLYSWELRKKVKTLYSAGMYSLHLRKWLAVFPQDRFLFLKTEEFSADMAGHLRTVFKHLGLRQLADDKMARILKHPRGNVGPNKLKAMPMWNSTRRILSRLYTPFVHELAMILQDERFLWKY